MAKAFRSTFSANTMLPAIVLLLNFIYLGWYYYLIFSTGVLPGMTMRMCACISGGIIGFTVSRICRSTKQKNGDG